jgi:predicted RNA-binding Zn ribbon-like protein
MPDLDSSVILLGGRLAVDFANAPSYPAAPFGGLSWEELVTFLKKAHVVSDERGVALLELSQTEPQTAQAVLSRAIRLRDSLREVFGALVRRERIPGKDIVPVNEILRITEGHDELVASTGAWKLEFIAREGSLDWLLAAVARSAAEIIVEGHLARLRVCANPECGMFFCDLSRTRRRRWCSMAVCGNRNKVASFARRHVS